MMHGHGHGSAFSNDDLKIRIYDQRLFGKCALPETLYEMGDHLLFGADAGDYRGIGSSPHPTLRHR